MKPFIRGRDQAWIVLELLAHELNTFDALKISPNINHVAAITCGLLLAIEWILKQGVIHRDPKFGCDQSERKRTF